MTDVTATTSVPPTPEPEAPSPTKLKWRRFFQVAWDLAGDGWVYLMGFMPQGMTTRRVITRMAVITLMVYATYNVLGLSYAHAAIGWFSFILAGFPAISLEQWGRVVVYVAWGLVSLYIYYHIFLKRSCKWRGIGFVGFMLWRVVPVAIVSFMLYNSYFSYLTVGREIVWLFFPETPWYKPWALESKITLGIFLVMTFGLIIAWFYVTKKAWQGLGASKMSAFLLAALIGSVLLLMKWSGIWPTGVNGLVTLLQFAAGLGLGFAFSLTFVDRQLSATYTSTTTVKDSDHHNGHHDHEQQQISADDAAAAEDAATDEEAAAHHR